MKKFVIILVISLFIVGCESNTTKEEKNNKITKGDNLVTIYLFHWTQCSHCKEEKEWLETMEKEYDYLDVKYYEVTEYDELVTNVRDKLGIEDDYVPLTVIGDQYFVGFSGSTKTKINKLIEKYKGSKYCDVINYIQQDKDITECHQINEQFN